MGSFYVQDQIYRRSGLGEAMLGCGWRDYMQNSRSYMGRPGSFVQRSLRGSLDAHVEPDDFVNASCGRPRGALAAGFPLLPLVFNGIRNLLAEPSFCVYFSIRYLELVGLAAAMPKKSGNGDKHFYRQKTAVTYFLGIATLPCGECFAEIVSFPPTQANSVGWKGTYFYWGSHRKVF